MSSLGARHSSGAINFAARYDARRESRERALMSSLGARHSSGTINFAEGYDARLASRAPSNEGHACSS